MLMFESFTDKSLQAVLIGIVSMLAASTPAMADTTFGTLKVS